MDRPITESGVGFKQIEIFHDQSLGIGAYGKVCRARCDNLMCAAKILHPTLVHVDQSALLHQQWPLQRFQQECELMSAIRHPNVVQYLGSHHDNSTHLPVLLMELMNDNLTHYLESSANSQPIPYRIQVNICHDITLALVFLHSNNIIHRDLSSNNVLLTSSFQAKVTDFGMAKLNDLSCQVRGRMTVCPGTNVYMPPEAIQDQPVYTEKIDCFSFGVIAIQIITRQFPDPGDRYLRHADEDSATLTIVPEIERRHNHISQIDPTDPILCLARDCLEDNPVQRLSAQHLCESFAHLKHTPRYSEQATPVELDNSSRISHHVATLRLMQQTHRYESDLAEKHHTILSLRRENQHLSQQQLQSSHQVENLQEEIQWLHQQMRENDQLEAQKDREVRREILRLREQLEHSRQEVRIKNQRIEGLESQTESQRQRHIQQIRGLQEIILSQRRVIDDISVHISEKNRMIAHKDELMDAKTKEIDQLEQQLRMHCIKEDTNSHLSMSIEVLVRSSSLEHQSSNVSLSASSRVSVLNVSANVHVPPKQQVRRFQLNWNSENKRAPCGMAAHCNAVVHGKLVYFQPTDTNCLYAYNSEADNWNQLPDVKNSNCSMAIVNDVVTAIGGSKLIRGHSRKLYSLTAKEKGMKWTEILPPMQTKRSESCALCIEMALIVAGGEGKNGKALATVEVMNTSTNQWSFATDLPEPLWGASSIVCANQFFVIGGVNVRPTRSVYRCAVSTLLQSCQPTYRSSYSMQPHLWDRACDLPVVGPTCVSLYEQLILVGGEDSNTRCRSAAIHMFDQTTGEWVVISRMSSGRNQCFAAVVPDNQLVIVGGWINTTQDETASNVVEIATAEILDPH